MILESVHIKNWRKLGNVNVQALSPKITVIHAPNKTGKTSMLEAVRCGLIDYDYDTSRVASVVPWGRNVVPEVRIIFRVGGQRYLLTKRYTKRKEGGAELYDVRGDQEPGELLAKDKTVGSKTRQVLGVERSDRGVARLLWVSQGVVDVPRIDGELEKSLRPLLGSVIGGGDVDFRRTLWERMKDWFSSEQSAARGRHRKDSRLRELEEEIERRQQEVEDIKTRFETIDALLSDVERRQQEIAEADALVADASREVDEVKRLDRELEQKREKARELQGAVETTKRELSQLEDAVERSRKFGKAGADLRRQLDEAEEELGPLVSAERGARRALTGASGAREKAEKGSDAIHGRRALVDAMRELVRIDKEAADAGKALRKVEQLEKRGGRVERKLSEVDAPSKKEINTVEKLLGRIVQVDADLKAAELSLTVTPSKAGSMRLEVDGQAEKSVTLRPEHAIEQAVRQRVRIGIRNFGKMEVVRGAEDKSVEELASEREHVQGELSGLLGRWGADELNQSEILPELSRRITQREALETQIRELRKEVSEVAPEGKEAVERETAALGKERASLLRRHSELKTWKPSTASLQQAESQLEVDEEERQETLSSARDKEKAAREQVENAEKEVKTAETEVSKLKTELAKAEALRDSHKEEHGTEEELAKAIKNKKKELEKNQKEFDRHRLSEDEERVPERLEAAEDALRKRRERVHSLREQVAHLIGQLQSSEGLHAQRVTAEQALESAKRGKERLSAEIDAHIMLLRLFDEVRDESVEKSIKPVSELVGGWLAQLEGPTHYQPAFGSDLSVTGITVPEAGTLGVEDATSYGEREQWATLIRLAYGGVLAEDEPQVVILDDPLAHADAFRHRKMLDVIRDAAERNLQVIIMTSHPERFDHLKGAVFFDLEQAVKRSPAGSGDRK